MIVLILLEVVKWRKKMKENGNSMNFLLVENERKN